MSPAARTRIVRVYEDTGRRRGEYRVLVDRLWPRGLTKEAVDNDEWEKDVAPSSNLRRWYGHEEGRFAEFAERYRAELASPQVAKALSRLRGLAARQELVLLTATRDVDHSAAAVLLTVLNSSSGPETRSRTPR
jgi:uncharacterized protein YeaO (DUF488 family)